MLKVLDGHGSHGDEVSEFVMRQVVYKLCITIFYTTHPYNNF